jgi:drug/metabolite transporter (DMT)-like permease
MIGLGETFALASAVTWAFAVILLRKSGETLPPFELNLFKVVLGFALMLPTAALLEGLVAPTYTPWEWLILLTSGFLGIAVADTWFLRALNLMGASRTAITSTLLSPFVIVLSVFILGERLHGWQYPGLALVLAGVFLVNWRVHRSEVEAANLRQGLLYGISAVFAMALGVVMVKEILEQHPFFWTVQWRLAGGAAGMLIYTFVRRDWPVVMANFARKQPWFMITSAALLGTYVSMLLWLAGYKYTSASVASMLNESTSAFIVLFAWLFLKEPLTIRKTAGLGLTLAGIFIVLAE